MLAAFVEVGVREFEKSREYVRVGDTLPGKMAVRVEFGCDKHIGTNDGAHALQQIAFAIVVALRDHRAVQPENDAVQRQGGAKLIKDLVSEILESFALQKSAGFGPGRCAFDKREAFVRASTQSDDRRGAQGRRGRMLPRRRIERGFKTRAVGRHWRERVGFGGERGGENAHGGHNGL